MSLSFGLKAALEHRCDRWLCVPFILQARMPLAVERESYSGPVVNIEEAAVMKSAEKPMTSATEPSIHSRPPTRGGGRNMQDSSFSLSGQCFLRPSLVNHLINWFCEAS